MKKNTKVRSCPAPLGNPKSNLPYDNSATSQRARILQYFATCPRLSTMQARNELGILHPCGRIMELRKLGYQIDTLWVYSPDNNSINHRIALYIFHGIDWRALEKRLIATDALSHMLVDRRYEILKAEIAKKHLSPEQYKAEIQSLCKFLNY